MNLELESKEKKNDYPSWGLLTEKEILLSLYYHLINTVNIVTCDGII